jgi:hypothetical protein
MFIFDFEKERWFQPFKTLSILGLIGGALFYFIDTIGGIDDLDYEELTGSTPNFGFALGIIAYSFGQTVHVPYLTMNCTPEKYFKLPIFLALLAVSFCFFIHFFKTFL